MRERERSVGEEEGEGLDLNICIVVSKNCQKVSFILVLDSYCSLNLGGTIGFQIFKQYSLFNFFFLYINLK